MDLDFQRAYGRDYLRYFGTADRWPMSVQVAVAIRGYISRGFTPGPAPAGCAGYEKAPVSEGLFAATRGEDVSQFPRRGNRDTIGRELGVTGWCVNAALVVNDVDGIGDTIGGCHNPDVLGRPSRHSIWMAQSGLLFAIWPAACASAPVMLTLIISNLHVGKL